MEAAHDRARREAWFTKQHRMPVELKTTLYDSGIPVDIGPVFAFPDKVQ